VQAAVVRVVKLAIRKTVSGRMKLQPVKKMMALNLLPKQIRITFVYSL
jgi:hypothetical protein